MQISGQEPEGTVAAHEREIDQILADSFPASDAPPWTLGVPGGASYAESSKKRLLD